MKFFLIEATH